MELQICDITKRFGEKNALEGVSFSACGGQPLGLLGRNGAGKTTLMRIIMNIFLPDSGCVLLDGRPASAQPRRLGYLPEERGLYERMLIEEQLIYIARLRGMSRDDAQRACACLLDRLDMSQYRRARPQTLSKGSQQRIQLAMALISDPDIIILDEPFSGLDPVNAMQLRSIVTELADSGRLVIISSHQMSTVENFCDHVVMLNRGRVALDASLSQLRSQNAAGSVRIRTDDDSSALAIASRFGKAALTRDGLTVSLSDRSRQNALLHALLDSSLGISLFEVSAPSLEEIFVSVCGDQPTAGFSAGGEPHE